MNSQDLKIQHVDESMELLRPVAYFLGFLYFTLAVAHFFLLQGSFKWFLFFTALLTACTSVAIGIKTSSIPSSKQCLVILLLMILASSNSLLHLWFSASEEQTTNLFVCIIASGIVMSNRIHWVISILFNWIGWLMVNVTLDLALTQHYFFAMAMSTLLSWFAHLARRNLVNKQLELASERDIALQHEKEAQAATRAKSAFLATMSHEIRTPMNGIIGMSEMLSNSTLDEKQQSYVATTRRSAESLLNVINDILDFSKIEAGELSIEKIEFDVEKTFADLIHDFGFQASNKSLILELVQLDCVQTKVVGDPLRLTQILTNLLSNAIKFTKSGKIRVEYWVVSSGDGLNLKVVVTDTGIGISETALPMLFESFSQADMSTTRNYGGTGLGLAISKQLCELMGGDISVKSELGMGSAFQFNLILSKTNASANQRRPPSNKVVNKDNLAELKVLLVEDNDINQEVMLAILDSLKVEVVMASDGIEALNLLGKCESADFDLVLMDCQMPKLDGYQTTIRIRSGEVGEVFSNIPIIALTANTMKSDRERCLTAGMNDYLTKPINTEALRSALQKYQ